MLLLLQVSTLEEDNPWELLYSLSHLLLVFTLAMLPSLILNAPVSHHTDTQTPGAQSLSSCLHSSHTTNPTRPAWRASPAPLSLSLKPHRLPPLPFLPLSTGGPHRARRLVVRVEEGAGGLAPQDRGERRGHVDGDHAGRRARAHAVDRLGAPPPQPHGHQPAARDRAVLFFSCPLFSYIGVMATEAGLVDFFEDLKLVLMRFLPRARRRMQTLLAERAQLQNHVRAFIHKVGPADTRAHRKGKRSRTASPSASRPVLPGMLLTAMVVCGRWVRSWATCTRPRR